MNQSNFNLRISNQEHASEEMAEELAELVRGAIGDIAPVLVGTYAIAS